MLVATTYLFYKNLLMEKQIQKIEQSIKKVETGIIECFDWKYKNSELIIWFLNKREKVLQKTRKKLIAINMENLINWQE